ncbi:MAG: mechanosensitive ion channel family protein [Gemmatimonadaceae bacterium]
MNDAWNTTHVMLRGFVASIPRFALAIVLALIFYLIGVLVRRGMARASNGDSSHRTLNVALGRIAHGAIVVVGFLFAVAAAFPGFTPGNLVSALGIGGIAIGFAFKDIFENFLSGILILLTRPFRIGDQIIYDRYEGTVEDIHMRATWLRTSDGRRVVIPNSALFTNSVTVNTAFESRRLEYDFKVRNGDAAARAKQTIEKVLRETKDVLPEPKPDVVITAFDDSMVLLKARWWSRSQMVDVLVAHDRVLSAVQKVLEIEGIEIPPAVQVVVQSPAVAKDGDGPSLDSVKPDPH